LKSDLRTVKTLQSNVKDRSSCWILYTEGWKLSICEFDRACNGLVHGLAHLGKKGGSGSIRDSVPGSLAAEDCNWVDEPLVA
jgi:hypothetical protein